MFRRHTCSQNSKMTYSSVFYLLIFLNWIALGQSSEPADQNEKCVQGWLRKQPRILNRFRRDQLSFMCKRSHEWNEAASSPTAAVADFLTLDQLSYLGQLRDCQGSDCLRYIGTGGGHRQIQTAGVDSRALRKEYRAMSDEERRRYHEAIKKLKLDKIDGIAKYDLLVIYHTPQEAPEAHWGPAFLAYHREYLKQYEVALRRVDSSVGLPYWDSTLDEGLPNPKDSILWTADFLGNADGPVTVGPFAGWMALQELPNMPGNKRLVRSVGPSPFGGLYQPSDVDFILNRTRFAQLTSCVDPTFEMTHGLVHAYVGGYMLDVGISPNDPAFYLHHCFIDNLWEQFRQTRQNSRQRQFDYPDPQSSCNEFHNVNAPMKPFGIRNVDGLSESYTRELYRYDDRPVCGQNGHCVPPSPYLFCDTRTNRCLSKIQLRGNCSGLESQKACYQGICKRGVCDRAVDVPEVVVTGGPDFPPDVPEIIVTGGPFPPTDGPDSVVTERPLTTQPSENIDFPPTETQPPESEEVERPPRIPALPPYAGGPCYNCVTAPSQASIPVAYITITVVKGFGGYYAQHASDAFVSVQGLGSPPGYVSAIPAAVWANTTAPSYVGACLVMIYDPDQTNQPVRFSLSATDARNRRCMIKCWDDNRKRYGDCSNGNSFQVMAGGKGDPIPYFRTSQEALQRRWTGTGYQRFRLPDYVVFQCL